jgi:adenine-specific DNA-methyltransferase
MDLTRYELKDNAEFVTDYSFRLLNKPDNGDYPLGLYELPRRSGESYLYRIAHPLAVAIIKKAKDRQLKPASIEFDLTGHRGRISILEEYRGKSGTLSVHILSVNALDQNEEYFLFAGITSDGTLIDDEVARRLFSLNGKLVNDTITFDDTSLAGIIEQKEQNCLKSVSLRNAEYFENEADKLDGWAEDLKRGLERDIKDIDKQIKETRRLSVAALSLEEKLKYQKEIKNLESIRNTKRKSLFEAQDDIDRRRGELIAEIESKLKIEHNRVTLFEIEWKVI